MPQLRALRQKCQENDWDRFSRTAVAARLGVEANTLTRWELGHQRPHPRHLGALAREYGVSRQEIEDALS